MLPFILVAAALSRLFSCGSMVQAVSGAARQDDLSSRRLGDSSRIGLLYVSFPDSWKRKWAKFYCQKHTVGIPEKQIRLRCLEDRVPTSAKGPALRPFHGPAKLRTLPALTSFWRLLSWFPKLGSFTCRFSLLLKSENKA